MTFSFLRATALHLAMRANHHKYYLPIHDTGIEPLNDLEDKYKDSMLKLAHDLAEPPFNMQAACEDLKLWVTRTRRLTPIVLLPALALRPCHVRPTPVPVMPALPALSTNIVPCALEPACSAITMHERRPTVHDRIAAVSPEGKFQNETALGLVREHNFDWEVALRIAKQCWARLPSVYREGMMHESILEGNANADAADPGEDGVMCIAENTMSGELPVRC